MPTRRYAPVAQTTTQRGLSPDVAEALALARKNRGVSNAPTTRRVPVEPVGSHLHDIIEERYKAKPNHSCTCEDLILQMDRRGVAWCDEHREEIVAHLANQTDQLSPALRYVLRLPGGRRMSKWESGRMLDQAIKRTTDGKIPKRYQQVDAPPSDKVQ